VFQISNLRRIKTDINYKELRELYAENNQIVSVSEIEASEFIKNFHVLDIRGNKLTGVSLRLH
jgi:Leucine-rich repeat (LRR) protein